MHRSAFDQPSPLRVSLALIVLVVLSISSAARASGSVFTVDASKGGGTLRAGGPAKGVNTVIPGFKVAFSYPRDQQGRPQPRVTKVLIRPAIRGATVIGGCERCRGGGRFTSAKTIGDLLSTRIRGRLSFGARTRLVIGYIRGEGIGRYRLYGVSLHPLELSLIRQGCLAAGTISLGNGHTSASLLGDLLNPRSLPQVPCAARTPRSDRFSLSAPPELSTSTPQAGRLTGRASGRRWLTVYQSHRRCATNPLDESVHGFDPRVYAVRGGFRRRFSTGTDTRPGYFCAYLQIGGRFRGLPTGRVTATWQSTYIGGDSVALNAPSQVLTGQGIPSTVTGVAAVTEQVWVFASDGACASTAEAEAAQRFAVKTQVVKGTYSVPFSTAALTQSANVCAYVQSRTSKRKPAGATLLTRGAAVALAVGSLTLSGPTTIAYGQSLTTIASGSSSVPATIWSFTSFAPCAATAAAESPLQNGSGTAAVSGPYDLTLPSHAITQFPGPLYRCDYLVEGTSISGPMLASAGQTVTEEYVYVSPVGTVAEDTYANYAITGTAAQNEFLYYFTDSYTSTPQGCATDAQGEYQQVLSAGRNPTNFADTVTAGNFSFTAQSPRPLLSGNWYVCVYLQTGGLSPNGDPTGAVISDSAQSFTVS